MEDFAVLEMAHGRLFNNMATAGGGISLENSVLFSYDLVVRNNTSSGPGGGIHVSRNPIRFDFGVCHFFVK